MKKRSRILLAISVFLLGSIGIPGARALQFPAGQRRGAPTITTGTGTRGDDTTACLNTKDGEMSFNALAPHYSNEVTTASGNPTLYFYLPPTRATTGEATLEDEEGKQLYRVAFPLPGQAGIAHLSLPPLTPLVAGKTYRWQVAIVCDPEYPTRNETVAGTLQYRPLDRASADSLTSKNFLEKAKFYAGRGDWLDTLDNVARARSQQPGEWTELLDSVGLNDLSGQPLLDCCAPEKKP